MKKTLSTLLASVVAIASSQGATIAWTTDATTTTSVNDIDLTGTLVHAGVWGTGTQNVNTGSEIISFVDLPINGSGNQADVTASGETPQGFGGDTGNAEFNNVLNSFAYDGANPKVFTLSGLTATNIYQVQIFMSDDRTCCAGRTQNWSDNITLGAGNFTSTVAHGTSSFFIGEFTADGPTQTIYGHGTPNSQTIINGYVLRQIPEPSAFALVGLAGAGLLFRRRR